MPSEPFDAEKLAKDHLAILLCSCDCGRAHSYAAVKSAVGVLTIAFAAGQAAERCAWQTMDSAPRDGTKFDVWYVHHDAPSPTPAHRVTDVYWSNVQDAFCVDGDYGPEEPSPLAVYPRPSHWRAIPAPPPGAQR